MSKEVFVFTSSMKRKLLILGLAGIKDAWVKTHGQTRTRTNLMYAMFEALRNLNRTKGSL